MIQSPFSEISPVLEDQDIPTDFGRLGYALHMLGCIESKHDRHIESTKLWQRALVNYRETMGDNYHRTGTVCAKLAQNYARAGQHETARYERNILGYNSNSS